MNAVVSQRKEVKLQPNAERFCEMAVSTCDGRYITADVYVSRKVRGAIKWSIPVTASASAKDCQIFRTGPSWALYIDYARFTVTEAEANQLIAEFGLKLEEARS